MQNYQFCFSAVHRMNDCGLAKAKSWKVITLAGLADAIRNAPPDAPKGDAGGILAPGYVWPFRPSSAGNAAAASMTAGASFADIATQSGEDVAREAAQLQGLRAQRLFVVDVDISTRHLTTAEAKEAYKAEHRRHRERLKERLAAHPACLLATLSHNAAWGLFVGDRTEEARRALQAWIDAATVSDADFQPIYSPGRYIVTDCRFDVDEAFFKTDAQCRYITHDPAPYINPAAVPLAVPTPKERAAAFMSSALYRMAAAQTRPFRGLRTDPEKMRRCPWVAVAAAAPAVVSPRRIQTPGGGTRPTNILAALAAPSDFGKGAVLRFLPAVLRGEGVPVCEASPKTNEALLASTLEASGLRKIEIEDCTEDAEEAAPAPSSAATESQKRGRKPRRKTHREWRQVEDPRGLFVTIDEAGAFLANARERKELSFLLQGFRLFWDGHFTVNRSAGRFSEMPDALDVHGACLLASTESDELDFFRDGGKDDGNAKRFLYFALSRDDTGQAKEGELSEPERLERFRAALGPLLALPQDAAPVAFSRAADVLLELARVAAETGAETHALRADEYALHVTQLAAAEAQLNGRLTIEPQDVAAALWVADGEDKSLEVIRSARADTAATRFEDDLRRFFADRRDAPTGKALSHWLTRRKDTLPNENFRKLDYLEDLGFILCDDLEPPRNRVDRHYIFGFADGGKAPAVLPPPKARRRAPTPAETAKRKAAVLSAAATPAGLATLADETAAAFGLSVKTRKAEEVTLGHEGSKNRRGGFNLALKEGRFVFHDFTTDANGDAFNLAHLIRTGNTTSAANPEKMSSADFGRALEWLERVLGISAFDLMRGGEQ